MSVEQNKALARKAFEEVINSGNLDLVDETTAAEFVRHDLGGLPDIVGSEAVKLFIKGGRAAFPDIHMTIEDLIAEGHKVVVRYTARGTHTGEFRGIAPTGKQVTWAGINIYQEEGGKVVETWQLSDRLGMMQQMGVIPSIGQPEG